MPEHFPPALVDAFTAAKSLYIRSGDHRFIGIWVVVVDGRVIVRSWNDKPLGWYRAFLKDRRGEVRLGDKVLPIRAVRLRSSKLNDAADAAYAAKYTSESNRKYVVGFKTAQRKVHTLELLPA